MKKIIAAILLAASTLYAQDDEPITNSVPVVKQAHVVRAMPRLLLLLDNKQVRGAAIQLDTNLNEAVAWRVPNPAANPINTNSFTYVEEKEVVENFQWFLNQIGSTQTVNQAIKNLKQGIQKKAKN